MTKDELLAAVNAAAAEIGHPAISKRALSDWIDEGLLPPAKAVGHRRGVRPTWSYSNESLQAARTILDLRKKGVTRAAALRVHLWVVGFRQPLSEVHSDLVSEYRRLLSRKHREGYWDSEAQSASKLDPADSRRLRKELSARHPALEATGIPVSPDTLTRVLTAAYWGSEKSVPELLSSEFTALASNLGVRASMPEFLRNFSYSGFMADPEHTDVSALDIIEKVAAEDLNYARDSAAAFSGLALLAAAIFDMGKPGGELTKLMQSIAYSDWLIAHLVMFATSHFRERMEGGSEDGNSGSQNPT